MTDSLALVLVAAVSAVNAVWCAAVWWRLRGLREEGATLGDVARRLDEAVARAREALEQLRAELVASERAVELRSREARARAAELARLLEAARRTGPPAASVGADGTSAGSGRRATGETAGGSPADTAGGACRPSTCAGTSPEAGPEAGIRAEGAAAARRDGSADILRVLAGMR